MHWDLSMIRPQIMMQKSHRCPPGNNNYTSVSWTGGLRWMMKLSHSIEMGFSGQLSYPRFQPYLYNFFIIQGVQASHLHATFLSD